MPKTTTFKYVSSKSTGSGSSYSPTSPENAASPSPTSTMFSSTTPYMERIERRHVSNRKTGWMDATDSQPHEAFFYVELLCNIWFIVEFTTRFLVIIVHVKIVAFLFAHRCKQSTNIANSLTYTTHFILLQSLFTNSIRLSCHFASVLLHKHFTCHMWVALKCIIDLYKFLSMVILTKLMKCTCRIAKYFVCLPLSVAFSPDYFAIYLFRFHLLLFPL